MFFLSKQSQKETFIDLLDRNKCFLDAKNKVLKKSRKNRHFKKGLVHGFCQKIDFFFISSFLSKETQKETFFDILDRKECFLNHKKKVLKNSKKSTFCKGVSLWFLSKNRPFSYKIFLEQKRKKETFFDILDRK